MDGSSSRARRRTPWVLAAVAALLILVGSGLVVYRVFRPHDTLTRPSVPYPDAMIITDDRPFGELRAAPLVIEGRLRVYAETWRVWADAPVGGQYEATPYWAFRRFPAEVVGVVDVITSRGPYVISQWSDGQIIAIDARAGEVAWRTTAPVAATKYDGRRTGASTVYEPRSLLTGRSGNRTILIATSPGAVYAFDSANGAPLWHTATPGGCDPLAWTGDGLIAVPGCSGPALTFRSVVDGTVRGTWTAPGTTAPTPTLCRLGRSDCRLATVGSKAWLLSNQRPRKPEVALTPVPDLEPGAVLAGDRVIYPTPEGITARRLVDGSPLWTWDGQATLLAADSVGVYVLTSDRTVLGLSPVTGRLSVLGCAAAQPNETWKVGHVHTTDANYIAIERINSSPPTAKDSVYYYSARPIALVELYPPTKLPVWPGKFAACALRP